jgi:hypothetical protein
MSDKLHCIISKMRDELKTNISNLVTELLDTRFAVLESMIRDTTSDETLYVTKNYLANFKNEITASIRSQLEEVHTKAPLVMEFSSSPSISNNIVVERPEASSMEEVESIADSHDGLERLEIDDDVYWLNEDNVVFKDTDSGLEEIGTYNSETGEIEVKDEDTDEEIETVEFTYKGVSYYRDEDNNVYNEDSEHIGTWSGTKIIRT